MPNCLLLPLLLLALFCSAGAKKSQPLVVAFFTESREHNTSAFAAPVTLHHPPRQAFIEKIPSINQNDVAAIFPFPAADGSMGCAFKLNTHGTFALETLSMSRRGTSLVAFVNGRQVIDMLIDQRVSDGIITIPRGLTPQDLTVLQKKYRTLAPSGR